MTVGITWDSFIINNSDPRGVQSKFEDLCRQIFVNHFLSSNTSIHCLHANPNNPGLEAEPVFDEKNNRWIGFQAKYFENSVSYSQIYDSAEKIVEYYSGKVDVVYLFCNKPITSSAKSFVKTIRLLESSRIKLELITDNAILDLIRSECSYLSFYYFGNHPLYFEWFEKHSEYMFDNLGERYTRDFNVETSAYDELSLFVGDKQAAKYLNNKKQVLLEKASEFRCSKGVCLDYLNSLKDIVVSFPDVDDNSLFDSEQWYGKLLASIKPLLDNLSRKRSELRDKLGKQQQIIEDSSSFSKEELRKAREEKYDIEREIQDIDIVLTLPGYISIRENERKLLYKDVLFVLGKGGSGKSQLLASKTKSLLDEGRTVLLLIAGEYYSDLPIQEQIMSNLRLDFSFSTLIGILETIGERENRVVPIFIDAVNETWNRNLWKNELPIIVDLIRKSPMVKLVISFRPEFESELLSKGLYQEKQLGSIVSMVHKGFEENSNDAIRTFLNHYNIPFSPIEFFGAELANPLFLSLYCKTFNGEEASLPELYERLLVSANEKIFNALKLHEKGYSVTDGIVRQFIMQMARFMFQRGFRFVLRKDLASFPFWTEFGIAPQLLIHQLQKEGLILNYVGNEGEFYFFSFDQMNDYFCARIIIDSFNSKGQIREYLEKQTLMIEQGNLKRYANIDLFVNACALYSEKYGEECIDVIDNIKDKNDRLQVFSRYLKSFQWRKATCINQEIFSKNLQKYSYYEDDLWDILIGNSVKTQNPLNADFLHAFLLGYDLNKRDYLWTIYVNRLPLNEDDRVVQLVKMYDEGETLNFSKEKQIELLLTLFGWMLTSSDRWFRDVTSKAMIELLKDNFDLCRVILEKYNSVDDPYVIQRLYGVVFGACCKRRDDNSNEFQILAEFVYKTIFARNEVYADILLRDYAREIIELFLYENPGYQGVIERKVITPPYKSKPIPPVKDYSFQNYTLNNDGISHIINSMKFDGLGMGFYGDFGRYVFQSALYAFEVDKYKIFNYAVYYILNKLRYKDKYFKEHDNWLTGYNRGVTAKCERIGKKYQWIAMFNILARVSDYYPKRASVFDEDEETVYEGPWNPFIRDFDPTLNTHTISSNIIPVFDSLASFLQNSRIDNGSLDYTNKQLWINWVSDKGFFLEHLKDVFLLTDSSEKKWVFLSMFKSTGPLEKTETRVLAHALFISRDQEKSIIEVFERGGSVHYSSMSNLVQSYKVFNREYPWAPSCREIKEQENTELWVQIPSPCLNNPNLQEKSSHNEGSINDASSGIGNDLPEKEVCMGQAMHASIELVWEAQYDASKDDPITRSAPCSSLIEEMGLVQGKDDCIYLDRDGCLASFDTRETQKIDGVLIRKDILDKYLVKKELSIIWCCHIEKGIHASGHGLDCYGEWEALYSYNGEGIEERMRFIQSFPSDS